MLPFLKFTVNFLKDGDYQDDNHLSILERQGMPMGGFQGFNMKTRNGKLVLFCVVDTLLNITCTCILNACVTELSGGTYVGRDGTLLPLAKRLGMPLIGILPSKIGVY